ncbi:MAG: dockerin type I repeat-containing protein, partial [Ruminococcus sp.]|nr:dockerin type I repeat-containing protein [Ruminococcus sp.]
NSDGELVYEETTDKGYVIYKTSYADEVEETIKVVISSERAESPVAAETTVTVEYFDFILEVDAPKKVVGGTLIELKSSTNVEAPVEYILTDKDGNFLNSSDDGLFEIVTSVDDEAGLLEYVVKAETTVDGITYTTSKNVVVEIIRLELSVDLTGPEKVEAGLDIDLIAKATVNDDVAIKYTFYNAEDMTLLGSNYTGAYIFSTDGLEAGALIRFIVEAECEAYGNVYTAKSDVITVEVEAVTDVFNVTVYFKSTSTYGYKPLISTTGTVKDVENEEMQKDIFICKNATETASYFWYKTEFSVSRKSPTAFIRILSSRYAMEVQTNLMINEDATYYFATDNLNDGTVLYDLTYASEDERNWCESAVHMVYDPKVDGEKALAEVSARVDLRLVGDTTADGKMNIRDATYIQKGLAGIITMSKTDMEVADVNDDLKVSIKDATCIQKKLAGIRN